MEQNPETGGLDDSTDLDVKLTEVHYNRAFGYLKLGELELATEAAQAALEINQDYSPALSLLDLITQEYFVIGLTSIKENKVNEAIRAFQFAVTIDPSFVDAYYEIGRAYLWQDDLDEAEKTAMIVLERGSESAYDLLNRIKQAYYARGRECLEWNELVSAKVAVDEALRLDSDYKPAHHLLEKIKYAYYNRGLNFLDQNEYDAAISAFEGLLAIDADFTEAYCWIARAHFMQDKLEAAGKAVSEALRLNSDYEPARELLKDVKYAYCDSVINFLEKNQYSTAAISFEDSLAVDTDYVEAKWKSALAYLEQAELEETEKVINEVLGFSSNYRFNLDYWFSSDCEFDSDYGFACALLEKIKHVYYDRGITALKRNQYDEAIINLENAIAIDASFAEAYIELQVAYLAFENCYLKQLEIEEDMEKNNIMKRTSEHIELLALSTKSAEEAVYLGGETEFSGNYKKNYDELRNWFRTVGRFKLLDRDEEVELAKRIEAGKTEYGHTGDAELARDQLVQANLRLVISIARKYSGINFPLEDLVQEGNIGLIKAASKFDYRWGHRFSSYASWWIKSAIMRTLNNSSRSIRLPTYFGARIEKFDAVYATLRQKLQREPYWEEIAEALDLTVRQVEKILMSKVDAISMDVPLSDGCFGETLGDLIGDLIEGSTISEQEGPIVDMINEDLVAHLLKELPEREQNVLKMRFGLEDGERKTLREISPALGVTRERVRQLEIEAIKRLRLLYDEMGEF
ncbi:MAG: sigma-70 family RNA polymerase sigma factor [Candidatus Poribacteria bacterium]|nr:sigma-70 family RNA polymerase sigma factor [Candidatus Poribacteria bacterium]